MNKRESIWNKLDAKNKGRISITKLEKGMENFVKLPKIQDFKDVIKRAFMSAKSKVKSQNSMPDG